MNLVFALEMLGPILIVGFSRVVAYEEQYFSVEPENQTAVFGSNVVLPCRIINKSGIAQWTINDFGLGDKRDLPGYDRYRMIGEDKDGNYSLEIFPVTLEDEGRYECQVGFGSQGQRPLRSRPVWLSVIIPTEPPVILQGSVVDVPEYDEVTLDCLSVAGRPPAEVIWKDELGNVIIENVRHKVKELPDGERFSVTSTLKLIVTRHDNNKVLTCQAQNGGEKPHKTAQVTLNVVYVPKVSVTVKSGADPSGRILQGAGVSVLRQVFPSLPGPDQEWFIGTQLIFGNKSVTIGHQSENIDKANVDCQTIGEPENAEVSFTKEGPKIFWNFEYKVEPALRNNVTMICTVEGNPSPEVAWIHGNTRQVVTKSNILSLAINRENIGLYYCKVSIKRLSAVLKSKHPYLVTDSTQVGILNTIDRVECTISPVPQANHIYLTFHNIDINGTTQKYSSLEELDPTEVKSIWLIREFEATGVDTYNWSDTEFHGFDLDFMKTWITTRRSFPVLMIVVGIVLGVLVIATLVLMFILSRKTFSKSFPYSGAKNLCLSDSSSKGSDCKLELVPETEDQSESEFTNDVAPTAPISVGTFRSTNSSLASGPNSSTKVNINDNYVSYIGYGKDYSPPAATRNSGPDLDRKNPFSLAIEPGSSNVSGSEYSNNPYLIALDSLLPENLKASLGNPPRLPCGTVWQDVSIVEKAKNPNVKNMKSLDRPMRDEMTLV